MLQENHIQSEETDAVGGNKKTPLHSTNLQLFSIVIMKFFLGPAQDAGQRRRQRRPRGPTRLSLEKRDLLGMAFEQDMSWNHARLTALQTATLLANDEIARQQDAERKRRQWQQRHPPTMLFFLLLWFMMTQPQLVPNLFHSHHLSEEYGTSFGKKDHKNRNQPGGRPRPRQAIANWIHKRTRH
jgi:hypothetical protein